MQPKLAHQSETQRIYTKNTLKKLKESDVSFLDLNFKTVDFEFDIYGPTFSLNLDSTVFQVGKCRKGLVPKALLDTLEHHRSPRARIKWTRHVEQCQRRLYKGEDCQGKMRKWSWPMKRCLGPGKCFCWEDMLGHNSFSGQSGKPREAKTSYAGMGNSHGWSVKMRRPGARDQETRGGKRGRCLCLSYCSPVSPGLSVSQCLRTQSAPIPAVAHLLRLLFLVTTESYSATVKYIALLSPSFSSERPPPPWQRERWKLTDFNLVGREGGR